MKIFFALIMLLFSQNSWAVGPGLTYHGRLLDPSGVAVTASSVDFKIQIRSFGVEDCLMYEETQTLDMSNSDGVFSLSVNDGTGVRIDNSGFSMKQILSNRNALAFAAGKCTNGALSWTPAATDGRKIKILFNDGTFANGTWEAIPAITVNFVPMAIEAQQVDGYSSSQILKIADGASTTGTELSSTNWGKLTDLINGASTQYLTPGSATFSSAPTWAGVPSAGSDLVNKNYVDSEISSRSTADGTVSAGSVNELAYYSANGKSLAGLSTSNNSVLVTNGAGVPAMGSTLPTQVQTNITSLGTIGSGLWNGTAIGVQYGGTGVNASAAVNGQLLVGNGNGFSLANLTQSANQGVSITNSAGGIALGTVQDLRSTATPNFSGLKLNNSTTELTQSVSMGTSYSMVWPGNVAATNGSVLTSTTAGLLSWQAPADISTSLSKISAASSTNTIDNADFSQIWNWSTATTQTSLSMSSDSLTTGSLLSLSTSNNSVNSTQGLLNVKNSGTSTTGILARFQSNYNTDSGLTVLNNGNVGIGTASPDYSLSISRGDVDTKISVSNGYSTTAHYPGYQVVNYMGDANLGNPELVFMNYRGQGGTPAPVQTGDILGAIEALGARNTTYSLNISSAINFKASENFSETSGGGSISFLTTKIGDNYAVEKMNIADNGYIDIGSFLGSGTRLKVSGQLVTGSQSISSSTIDFNQGNAITTSVDCGGNLNFQNLNDGGSYTLVVTGAGTSQCNFDTAVTGDDAGTVTYKFKPSNATRTASSHTIYSLIRVGDVVYVSWVSGF